jgi:hypothetical protein
MPLIPDKAAFQNSLASLPLVTYQPGETVIVDGSRTGRLLILKKGNVAIVRRTQRSPRWRRLAPYLVSSPSCLISRTQRTCAHWKPRSFT